MKGPIGQKYKKSENLSERARTSANECEPERTRANEANQSDRERTRTIESERERSGANQSDWERTKFWDPRQSVSFALVRSHVLRSRSLLFALVRSSSLCGSCSISLLDAQKKILQMRKNRMSEVFFCSLSFALVCFTLSRRN
jgi:hypothetical protein